MRTRLLSAETPETEGVVATVATIVGIVGLCDRAIALTNPGIAGGKFSNRDR
ncbi:hypothetical protein OGM63_26030 [Plectonema radiosum NIES-515]|uniref:Uncharacterized protein n=1 Tax=Plectonema radiosum NIES-515 TaxID=2986073 RepID=A0ABT3B6A9_9CYAN|nr:hypothetical protein [Plectonema radiosum]MCV3216923.1 hypothetical protein [Plectonema radiosum NIES-515]